MPRLGESRMELIFVGNMQFETNEVESVDFVYMAEDGESFGESCLYEHDAYVIPSRCEITSNCEWYCCDTNGNYVIFDNKLRLIVGYCHDDLEDLMRDYPNAKQMLMQDKCRFDWSNYENCSN